MTSFKDLQAAARMRDIVERMVVAIVNKERPGERIGLVYRADLNSQFAWVQFTGESEDNLVKVRVSKNLYPTKTVESHGSELADIVRVAGRPGAYYICDMIRGVGAVGIPVGTLLPFSGAAAPSGYYLCDGSELSRVDEADLFAVIGTTWGAGDGVTTFNLPDTSERFLLGASGTRPLGNSGGADTIGTGHLPPHTHGPGSLTVASKSGDNLSPAPNSTSSTWANGNNRLANSGGGGGTTEDFNNFSGSTGDGAFANNKFLPLYRAVNFIIKA